GTIAGEPHYSCSRDRVICEPYFENLGNEYRFFMISGKIGFIQVIVWDWKEGNYGDSSRNDDIIEGHGVHYRLHYDENWKLYWKDSDTPNIDIEKPKNWEELIEISKNISKKFPIVRIDFNK